MPRSGTGEYSTPLGVLAQPGFTIESAKYNLNVNDVANDLNAARPISAGGTSATNINEALVNLKGERSYQLISNYNADRFHPGSFASTPDAVGSPVAGHQFAGVCYTLDAPPNPSSGSPPNTDICIEARDFDDSANPPKKYVRLKRSGTWGAWFAETGGSGGGGLDQATADARYVNITGDTLTGFLTLIAASPVIPTHAAPKSYVDSVMREMTTRIESLEAAVATSNATKDTP